jgi:hypothetical protein
MIMTRRFRITFPDGLYSNEKVSWQFKCFIENSEEGILLIVLAGMILILSRPYWNLIF